MALESQGRGKTQPRVPWHRFFGGWLVLKGGEKMEIQNGWEGGFSTCKRSQELCCFDVWQKVEAWNDVTTRSLPSGKLSHSH